MKNIKKVLSIFLAVIMAISCCSVAFAADTTDDTCDHYPQILISGFGAGCVKFYYEDDPEQKSLFWPFESERFIKNLGNIDDYMLKSIKEKNPDLLHSIIYNYLMDCFSMLALNPDGSMMDGVAAEPVELRKTGDGKYELYYDCRQSPMLTATQLHDCINELLEETGCEKVELVGGSYGANVVLAYMYLYDDELDCVDTVLQCVPSIGGTRFLGELFSGNFEISAVGFCDFVDRLADLQIIPDFLYLMEEAGVLNIFLDALAVPVLREAIYDAVVDVARDFIATLPALWACIPDEYFDDAMEFIYGADYKSPDHKYAKLISDMRHFHYDVANNAADIFVEAEKNHEGLNMAFITKFGIAAIPFGTGENTMDDGFVTVPVSSFGATCATYKGKLPADYEQARYTDYNFMSPEWNIDASTGLFPFTTWYIKNLEHSEKNEDYFKLVDDILYKDLDVFTDSDWPQYLEAPEDDHERLIPLKAAEEEEHKTLYDFIWGIIRKIVLFPKMLFEKIFG